MRKLFSTHQHENLTVLDFVFILDSFVLKLRAERMGETNAIIEYKIGEQEIFNSK